MLDTEARTSDDGRPVGLPRSGAPDGAPATPPVGDQPPGPEADAHALRCIEFDRVVAHVAGYATTTLGAEAVRALRPATDRDAAAAELDRVEALRTLLDSDGGWPSEPIPDLRLPLTRLRVEGIAWSAPELRDAILLLASARRTRAVLIDAKRAPMARALLAMHAEALVALPDVEGAIGRVVDADGEVRDDASPALRGARRALRTAEADLVRVLESVMARLEPHHRVADASVTVRNGRYVIPVRREGRGQVGGLVHDASGSGATVFVEPPAAIEAMNRIRELEADVLREIDRLLRECTDRLRPHREAIRASLDALVALDSLAARARYAAAVHAGRCTLCRPDEGFECRDARHPLLLAQGIAVVPFSLALEPGERTLLVSGPNTGGKTVLLKALALCSAMAQAGIPAPVAGGSRLAVFDRFFADIGDEQSIQASLSTFSAHLKNLTHILHEATSASLVLVDELGSGTDPLEGAALGGAVLEALTTRGTTTVATTHLGALKELAHEVPGVVNASLQFDPVALAPTYRLTKGIPGRSYGLGIARRLRMPAAVVARAEARIPQAERDVVRLVADLETRSTALAAREAEVAAQQEGAQARAHQLAEREQRLRTRERELERQARQESRRYLLEARAEVEQVIAGLKAAGQAQLEALSAEARRAVERRAGAEAAALATLDADARRAAEVPAEERGTLQVGDAVAVGSLGGKAGQVLALRERDATVAVGALKLTVPVTTLRRISKRHLKPTERAPALTGDQPEVHARHEVDVRGMRVDEMEGAVLGAVDDAVRADLKALRIIHGKGTGALRARVADLLRGDRRVTGFRLGLWNEGGAGVTVAEFS